MPQHAEKSLPAVNAGNRAAFAAVLESRPPDMSSAQAARIRRVIKKAGA